MAVCFPATAVARDATAVARDATRARVAVHPTRPNVFLPSAVPVGDLDKK